MGFKPIFISAQVCEGKHETEYAYVYYSIYDGPFSINKDELEEGRFWTIPSLDILQRKDILTPNFEQDYPIVKRMVLKRKRPAY